MNRLNITREKKPKNGSTDDILLWLNKKYKNKFITIPKMARIYLKTKDEQFIEYPQNEVFHVSSFEIVEKDEGEQYFYVYLKSVKEISNRTNQRNGCLMFLQKSKDELIPNFSRVFKNMMIYFKIYK